MANEERSPEKKASAGQNLYKPIDQRVPQSPQPPPPASQSSVTHSGAPPHSMKYHWESDEGLLDAAIEHWKKLLAERERLKALQPPEPQAPVPSLPQRPKSFLNWLPWHWRSLVFDLRSKLSRFRKPN